MPECCLLAGAPVRPIYLIMEGLKPIRRELAESRPGLLSICESSLRKVRSLFVSPSECADSQIYREKAQFGSNAGAVSRCGQIFVNFRTSRELLSVESSQIPTR